MSKFSGGISYQLNIDAVFFSLCCIGIGGKNAIYI
jgi:hypothetical protein